MRSVATFRPRVVWCVLCLLCLAPLAPLFGHDLFWRLTSYFVAPRTAVRMPVLNGTFSRSENSIAWSRVVDLSVQSPAGRQVQDSARWDTRGDTSWLSYTTGDAGTYVVGLSTHPKVLELSGADFNTYLADDGVPDVLAARRRDGELTRGVRERYAKHVKAIFQVGDTRSDAWRTPLGYPAELVPLRNPYTLQPGDTLALRCLVRGEPVPNQYVMIGGRKGRAGDVRLPATSARCGTDGVVRVPLSQPGRWFVKFIHMTRVNDGEADYASQWASLTFEVRAASPR